MGRAADVAPCVGVAQMSAAIREVSLTPETARRMGDSPGGQAMHAADADASTQVLDVHPNGAFRHVEVCGDIACAMVRAQQR